MYLKSTNLRTLIYALQKISDIFNLIEEHDEDLLKTILFSVINFAVLIKNDRFPEWSGTDLVSTELGYLKYPLYRFCYDYIRWQEFDKTKVNEAVEAHQKLMLYNRHGAVNDDDLDILFNYYIHTEQEVRNALKNIKLRLSDFKNIPFYSYGKLAYSLVICHSLLNFDYSSYKEKMTNNLRNRTKDIDLDLLFLSYSECKSEDEKREFNDFVNAIKEAIEESEDIFGFTYFPDDINSFYDQVCKNKGQIIYKRSFISKFDFDKLLDMIFICTPSQLQDLRGIFLAIYRNAKTGDFIEDDVAFMQNLLSKIKEHISEMPDDGDKIIKLQLTYLISNLEQFIKQLS